MKSIFSKITDDLLNSLNSDEHLKLSIKGENSQFIRFSKSKVRQAGLVDDALINISLIKTDKTCSSSFTLTGNLDVDLYTAHKELKIMNLNGPLLILQLLWLEI